MSAHRRFAGALSAAGAWGLLALAILLLAPGASPLGQSREWWDDYEEARKIVEDDKASEDGLKRAKRLLQEAVRAQGTEGNLATYNPSVRIDYLPFFYLGWAEIRLGRYEEAARQLERSRGMGFVTKAAPREIRDRFQRLSGLVVALEPAGQSLERARKSGSVKECLGVQGVRSGPGLREAMQRLEGLLAAPTDAAGLESAAKSLDAAVTECVREVAGARLAKLSEDYRSERDAVNVPGLSGVLPASQRKQLEEAIAAGDRAEASGDEKALQEAARALAGMRGPIASAVDARIAELAREAASIGRGNASTLDARERLGARLSAAAARASGLKASGKAGAELASVVAAGSDLKGLVDQAKQALQPLLDASRGSLRGAKSSFDGWARGKSCEVEAVDASQAVRRASSDAGSALEGSSADEMAAAEGSLASVREGVEKQIAGALPRVRQQATGIIGSAGSVIANVASADEKARGGQLRQEVERLAGGSDICAIEKAASGLRSWVARVAPALEEGRRQAIARNTPHLEAARGLLEGFGGILDAGTVTSLQAPVARLADLLKNSYDPAAIDASGTEVRGLVDRAGGEVRGRVQEGITALDRLMKDPAWRDVAGPRRAWLESNLPGVRQAAASMESPGLLARFAREYPRARVEVALVAAFDALYARGDAAAAGSLLEELGPGIREASGSVNAALSYVYWWQARGAGEPGGEGLMTKAKEAWRKAKELRLDPSALGGSLFAPAFVAEMSGL